MDQRNIVALKGAKDVDERVDLAEMADVGGFFQGVLADGAYVYVFDGGVGELLRELLRLRCGLRAGWNRRLRRGGLW